MKYILFVLFFISLSINAIGQTYNLEAPQPDSASAHVPKSLSKNPILLADALTKGKNGDKEKFDAIFTWVALNIKYDYRKYYSKNGTPLPDIKSVLKYKSGICLDFAYLMDTLCKLSGIPNVTVLGYAKEFVFDVHDLIYLDNHAWNAVKLDGYWYVYDVTWSTGNFEYQLTSFSKKLIKLYEWLLKQEKRVKIKSPKKHHFADPYGCDTSTINALFYSQENYYMKRRFMFLYKILKLFQLKFEINYNTKINSNYYLCNPELFKITHAPDDPVWSLIEMQSIKEFEGDSSYYYLNDSLYIKQQRNGRICPSCDNQLLTKELDRNYIFKYNSFKFNPKNPIVPAICDYNIASIYFNESKPEEDSLKKINLIDTSLVLLKNSKMELEQIRTKSYEDYYLQKNKNRKKYVMLYDENKAHINFFKDQSRETDEKIKLLKAWYNRSNQELIFNLNKLHKSRGIDLNNQINNHKNSDSLLFKEKIKEITKNNKKIDSINNIIDESSSRLNQDLLSLKKNINKRCLDYELIIKPVLKSSKHRINMLDNYKKDIVDERRKINLLEKIKAWDLDSTVFTPAEKCCSVSNNIFKLIDIRNELIKNVYNEKLFLFKKGWISKSEVIAEIQRETQQLKDDICKLFSNCNSYSFAYHSYNSLKYHQQGLISLFYRDDKIETYRYKEINKELIRRKTKYRGIAVYNLSATNYKIREVKKNKKDFLKKLKDERKKNS